MEKVISYVVENKLATVKEYEKMSNHTSIQTGGRVRALFIPSDENSLISLIDIFSEYKVPFAVIGRGSNLLVSDNDLDIAIIKIANTLDEFTIDESGNAIVGAGYSLQKLAKQVSKLGYSGLEFAGGIPASLGGAIFMNAGAHSGQMQDVVTRVRTIDFKGQIKDYEQKDCNFGYRTSIFQTTKEIIVSCELKLEKGDLAEIFKRMMGNLEYRKEMQPLERPTFGSVFQNPKGFHSAALIEQAGLKGKKVGGAHISTKHSNFIVNHDAALTSDVIELIDTVREIVKENTGIELHNEVILLDEKSTNGW